MDNLRITLNSSIKDIAFDKPCNLAQLLIDNDIYIDRPCNGKGTCGKCKIKFISDAPSPNSFDNAQLTRLEIADGWRLSCKCTVKSNTHILLNEKNNLSILEHGMTTQNEIRLDDKSQRNGYGIAIDLGTTTIVVYLVSLATGSITGIQSAINPQRKYGDNVITRSEYIHSHKNGLEILRSEALQQINHLIHSLALQNNLPPEKIVRAVLSGNTIMQHIILGVDPFSITLAPFTPVFTEQKLLSAKKLGLQINSNADCYITNSVSGYIGGDIVSGIIAVELDKSDDTSLLIDIGTNGEMVLSHKGKMYACSVAAGPAFEGEHIKHGVGGIAGAISKVSPDGKSLSYETIGAADAIGICGSGLLDIIAYLLDKGIMDEMGTMDEMKCEKFDDEIVFYITDEIYISQRDVREIQLAKSAIAAGAAVLMQKADIRFDEIDHVYLAGGFGTYLNIESAAKIGLIDKQLKAKCVGAGNTAGTGSIKSLLSDKVLKSLNLIVDKVEYIELSLDKSFNDLFIENMIF